MKNDTVSDQKIPDILVVDDIPLNLVILSEILKSEGYKVRPVPDGMLALQAAEREKPDLILLDIMMPDMDGYEVCRRLKENQNLRDIPVIFISALNDTNNIVKGLAAGSVDYITKPFQTEEVKARVATHLKIYRHSKELIELNATKDKFFSIIAHDLRSPFNGFLGLTQIMVEELPRMTLSDIHSIVKNMRNSATNLFRLLENLLLWARMQQGKLSYDPEVIEIRQMVDDSLSMIKDSAKTKGIALVSEIPEDVSVLADNNMLQTIIRNLLSNAVKFTNKGGKVKISAKVTLNQSVEISVKDSGIGMSPAMLCDLFRLDTKTNRRGTAEEPSSGLGLHLCKDFIERHGGKLWIESEEGKGSTFSFSIPNKIE